MPHAPTAECYLPAKETLRTVFDTCGIIFNSTRKRSPEEDAIVGNVAGMGGAGNWKLATSCPEKVLLTRNTNHAARLTGARSNGEHTNASLAAVKRPFGRENGTATSQNTGLTVASSARLK